MFCKHHHHRTRKMVCPRVALWMTLCFWSRKVILHNIELICFFYTCTFTHTVCETYTFDGAVFTYPGRIRDLCVCPFTHIIKWRSLTSTHEGLTVAGEWIKIAWKFTVMWHLRPQDESICNELFNYCKSQSAKGWSVCFCCSVLLMFES